MFIIICFGDLKVERLTASAQLGEGNMIQRESVGVEG